MDSNQQPHRYTGFPPPPPQPSSADPYHHHQPRPPVHPHVPWFSNQFQYHPSHSPSPPPPSQWAPPPSQWGPPPPPNSDNLPPHTGSYPPPPYPYPTQPIHHSQFPPPPPPRPHVVPHLPPHSQEWGSSHWAPRQGWEYPANNNEEDWAAKARAWADAKTEMENQHPQSQFAPLARFEEQSHNNDQYPQAFNSHYHDISHQSLPLSYEKFPGSAIHHQPAVAHHQESASVRTDSSYVPDGHGHQPYSAGDSTSVGDISAVSHRQGNFSVSSVHQQEVPSSYSSVSGNGEIADQNEQSYKLLALQNPSAKEGQQHLQPLLASTYAYGNQSADPTTSLADQPLDFAPRFGLDHDLQMHSSYAYHDSVRPVGAFDSAASIPSLNTWTPPMAPGMAYPTNPPVFSSGPQHDPSFALPSVAGHAAPPFGRMSGAGLPSVIPAGTAQFDLTAGTALPSAAFSSDTYGISNMSERPKKASVPNWLKEEIKKAVITGSSIDHTKEDIRSIENEGVGKYFAKGDQADSKSIDSFRSTEEDEEDEDSVEATRTVAMNQEIKRVLTEVLLKVTDELFDEIATKVLGEDDLTIEVGQKTVASNHKVSLSTTQTQTPKASAKVLIPVNVKEPDTDGNSENSSSITHGDLLGLANYASDDEDDGVGGIGDKASISEEPDSNKFSDIQQLINKKLSDDMHGGAVNGSSQIDYEEKSGTRTKIVSDAAKTSSTELENDNSEEISKLNGDRVDGMGQYPLKSGSIDRENGIKVGGNVSRSSEFSDTVGSELHGENVNGKKSPTGSQGKETKMKEKDDRYEKKMVSSGKEHLKEVDTSKIRANEKRDESRRRQEERSRRKEKTSDQNDSKERIKEQSGKPAEKENESESRKRATHLDMKEDRKETDRLHRASAKDSDKKREHTKDKEEDRKKIASDSSRKMSRHSASIRTRGRNSKDSSVDHANTSSEDSDDLKRKHHSRKRNLSPSPERSRRRQVSRSPHSKHSQRRHSPYYSLEKTRGRSRSRSPVRRQR